MLQRIDSKHMPVICCIRCQKQTNSSEDVNVTVYKLQWADDKRALFEQTLNLTVNEAVSVFTIALSKVLYLITKVQMNGVA